MLRPRTDRSNGKDSVWARRSAGYEVEVLRRKAINHACMVRGKIERSADASGERHTPRLFPS
jgi:hypothetical protein